MGSLFITGFSGFIGRNLIQAIDSSRYDKIFCLSRQSFVMPESLSGENFEFVRGNICEPVSYSKYLRNCETVIHLAAATGKALPRDYYAVNSEGTRLLLRECEQNGVTRFLYASTIAVKFQGKRNYHYALSKEEAENSVGASGLRCAIVRPTIVIGKESMIWKTLYKIASKPLVIMPGNGKTLIQPIHIDDLVDCLLTILYKDLFNKEIFELGGPEIVTFEDFLRQIHSVLYGKDPKVLHIPAKFLTAILALAEKFSASLLPINSGQISAFTNDGTIQVNDVFQSRKSGMKTVEQLIRQVMAA